MNKRRTHWGRLGMVVAAAAAMVACSSAQPTAQQATPLDEPLVTLPAAPAQVVAAAEQAFIELNLRPASAATTAGGGCALAHTADGDVVTVTATMLTPESSRVQIHIRPEGDRTMMRPLLESIAAHLSVGATALAR